MVNFIVLHVNALFPRNALFYNILTEFEIINQAAACLFTIDTIKAFTVLRSGGKIMEKLAEQFPNIDSGLTCPVFVRKEERLSKPKKGVGPKAFLVRRKQLFFSHHV